MDYLTRKCYRSVLACPSDTRRASLGGQPTSPRTTRTLQKRKREWRSAASRAASRCPTRPMAAAKTTRRRGEGGDLRRRRRSIRWRRRHCREAGCETGDWRWLPAKGAKGEGRQALRQHREHDGHEEALHTKETLLVGSRIWVTALDHMELVQDARAAPERRS